MKTLKTWAAAAAMVALTGAAQAGLVSLGDGTVKDTNTNLIWLQDWNFNGLQQNWFNQKAWAEGLTFAGSSDWVLPSFDEYFALRQDYGNLEGVSKFTNVQNDYYWSGTESDPANGHSMSFRPTDGNFAADQYVFNLLYAVAVRPGDVAASVPEPQTLALALLALGATVVARRRRSR